MYTQILRQYIKVKKTKFLRNIIKNIFSVTNAEDRKHKII